MDYCRLWEYIDKAQLNEMMKSEYPIDVDYSFLCFENIYFGVAEYCARCYAEMSNVYSKTTIIDLGCAYGFQSALFTDTKVFDKYIGVDISLHPKYETNNSVYFEMSIQNFIKNELPKMNLENVIAICSYVPDEEARRLVRETFDNCIVYYPPRRNYGRD
ncbi:MAG: hypothetical protein MJZ11_08340 [Lachnospiraceae bacterium]|nr:hypothetical protein [Lachnospiraceae bacterium]